MRIEYIETIPLGRYKTHSEVIALQTTISNAIKTEIYKTVGGEE